RCGLADLLAGRDGLTVADSDAALLQVEIDGDVTAPMVDRDVVRRLAAGGDVLVRLPVVRVDDRSVERGEDGNADPLLREAAEVGVVPVVAVVRVGRAVPVEDAR